MVTTITNARGGAQGTFSLRMADADIRNVKLTNEESKLICDQSVTVGVDHKFHLYYRMFCGRHQGQLSIKDVANVDGHMAQEVEEPGALTSVAALSGVLDTGRYFMRVVTAVDIFLKNKRIIVKNEPPGGNL